MDLVARLLDDETVRGDAQARELLPLMNRPVRRSTAGFPYLDEPSWVRFRDWVPHTFGHGPRALAAARLVVEAARRIDASDETLENLESAVDVVRQIVWTAAITAPPDLWLLRHVLGTFHKLGLSERMLAGEVLTPGGCPPLVADELRVDLAFLLARGLLLRVDEDGLRLADHESATRAFAELAPVDDDVPAALTPLWAKACTDDASEDERELLLRVAGDPPAAERRVPGQWAPVPEEIEIGYRLVPLVLGLRASGRSAVLLSEGRFTDHVVSGDAKLAQTAADVLRAAGVLDADGGVTSPGQRVLERGAGPFGIIEAYHAYMQQLPDVLEKGRGEVWVERRANVDASQAANRKSFERANDALDAFCEQTGFTFQVFIEHAIGRGEATRQRFARSGETLRYVGADLEDAAIDAAIEERDAGNLPANMIFVRKADIGDARLLTQAMSEAKLDTEGAVMLVGNGFHEVRGQTDQRMTDVFAAYERAGLLLLFTEETALAVEDLLATAWNTYHAGFKYVHQRSGQGLRPAVSRPPSALEDALPLSWTECAERAGYVRADRWSRRSRTVYPYTPVSGHNPAISVNHFFVPRRIAERLGFANA